MKKLKRNELGFSLIEGLLIILILAVISFGGYYVYRTQHKSSVASTISTKTTTPPTTKTKYLTITQWGIRAPYVSSDTLSYALNNEEGAIIISENMSNNYGCTGTNNLPAGAGLISRNLATATLGVGTTPTSTYTQLASSDPKEYKLIGNYVYGFGHDQAACQANTTTSGEAAQTTTENLTESLIPKLETVPSS